VIQLEAGTSEMRSTKQLALERVRPTIEASQHHDAMASLSGAAIADHMTFINHSTTFKHSFLLSFFLKNLLFDGNLHKTWTKFLRDYFRDFGQKQTGV
jgi:hypothetical protein